MALAMQACDVGIDMDRLEAAQSVLEAMRNKENMFGKKKEETAPVPVPDLAQAAVIAMREKVAAVKAQQDKYEADREAGLAAVFKPVHDIIAALSGCSTVGGLLFGTRVDVDESGYRARVPRSGHSASFRIEAVYGFVEDGRACLVKVEGGAPPVVISTQAAVDSIVLTAVELGIRLPGE